MLGRGGYSDSLAPLFAVRVDLGSLASLFPEKKTAQEFLATEKMSDNVIEEVQPTASSESGGQSEQTAEGSEVETATGSGGKSDVVDDDKERDEPPKKKSKKSSSKKAANAEPASAGQDKYPFARSRGIRIFSDREIESQDAEMTKEYWRFWNDTAEELCSDRAYNDWGKRDLKLYIDAAWIIHKTYLQELRERELAGLLKELQEKYGYAELPAKLKSQDQAVTNALSKVANYLCVCIRGLRKLFSFGCDRSVLIGATELKVTRKFIQSSPRALGKIFVHPFGKSQVLT